MERRIKLRTLNPYITCKICKGYLIDATTVTECLHTFCKSCLVKYLEENNTCPQCKTVIHQSHPLQYISFDRTLQDIVYKLVPDLQKNEIEREKEFCRIRTLPYPRSETISRETDQSLMVESNDEEVEFHRNDEQVGIELITTSESLLKQIKARYIKCSANVTIDHIKKLVSINLYKTVDRHADIDLFYNEELLGKHHTLKFVYVTRWRFRAGPLKLYYKPSHKLL